MGAKKKIKIQTEKENAENKNKPLPENESAKEDPIQPDDPMAELESKLESAEKELQETHDRFLRASAEFENYKKRSARDMADFRKFANETLIKEMLSVVDNLERALDSTSKDQPENKSVTEGVQMTLAEILKIFEKFQVKQIESLGKTFDPGFHQAVMQEETDNHPDKTVLKELQKGYLMHDKLVRPAMVVVPKKKSTTVSQENNEVESAKGDNDLISD